MSEEEDVGYLILAVFHTYNEILVHQTSKMIVANCGHKAWIAMAGRRHLKLNPGLYTICDDCYYASTLPADAEALSAPGALEEVELLHGPQARKNAEQWFRRRFGKDAS